MNKDFGNGSVRQMEADPSFEGEDEGDDFAWAQAIQKYYFDDVGGYGAQTPAKSIFNRSYIKSIGADSIMDSAIAVKKAGNDEIYGYMTMWGNPDLPDLEAEYFTPQTDFWDGILGKMAKPLTWNHAQDRNFKGDVKIGSIVDWGDDEIGRWYIATLDRSHKYRKAIEQLIAEGKLGTSSDSVPQYVERVKNGKATWLKSWPLFSASLTDTPAEPRMVGSVEYYKSLGISLPDSSSLSWDWSKARMKRRKI